MEAIVASVDGIKFDVETQIEVQVGIQALAFPGMDKTVSPICLKFFQRKCSFGAVCPYRHIIGEKTVVCKHWLRGLCKKGDDCEFLHEFDMTKMPECYFYSRFNACHNKECPFLHIDPETKIRDCPWYDRGFCRHGPICRHRHTRRVMCTNYLAGFCPDGANCKHVHPTFDLPSAEEFNQTKPKKGTFLCHNCHEPGHKIMQCPKLSTEDKEALLKSYAVNGHMPVWAATSGLMNMHESGFGRHFRRGGGDGPSSRPLEEVICFKCGGKGHYANKCPKGHLAFLSSDLKNVPQKESNES